MAILSNLDPSVLFGSGVLVLLVAFILQGLVLYVYKQDNTLLRSSLAGNIKSMQAERKHHAEKIKALEARVELIKKGNDLANPEIGVQIDSTEVKVLRASATFDRSEPQYDNQTDEYLLMMSRQEIMRYTKDYISTEIIKTGRHKVTFEHTLMVVKNGLD